MLRAGDFSPASTSHSRPLCSEFHMWPVKRSFLQEKAGKKSIKVGLCVNETCENENILTASTHDLPAALLVNDVQSTLTFLKKRHDIFLTIKLPCSVRILGFSRNVSPAFKEHGRWKLFWIFQFLSSGCFPLKCFISSVRETAFWNSKITEGLWN